MCNRTLHRPEHGFSVIEVMIALVVLGVGITAMAQLQKASVDAGGYARQSTKAAALAKEKAAELAPLLREANAGSDEVTYNGVKFSRTWTVDPNAATQVNVSVNWPDAVAPISINTVNQLYTPDFAVAAAPPKLKVIRDSISSSSCKQHDDDYENDLTTKSCSGTVSSKTSGIQGDEDD